MTVKLRKIIMISTHARQLTYKDPKCDVPTTLILQLGVEAECLIHLLSSNHVHHLFF
jgi:hypothetical protein